MRKYIKNLLNDNKILASLSRSHIRNSIIPASKCPWYSWIFLIRDGDSVGPVCRGLRNQIIIWAPDLAPGSCKIVWGLWRNISLSKLIRSPDYRRQHSPHCAMFPRSEFDINLNSDTEGRECIWSHEVVEILGKKFLDMFGATQATVTPTPWEPQESSITIKSCSSVRLLVSYSLLFMQHCVMLKLFFCFNLLFMFNV